MSPAPNLAPPSATALAGRAWGDVRKSFSSLWPLWIAGSVYGAGSTYWSRVASPERGHVTGPWLIYLALSTIGGAILSGPAARAFLGGGKPWWTLDSALARYVLLDALGGLLIESPNMIPSAAQTGAAQTGAAQTGAGLAAAGAMLGVALFKLVGVFVLVWIVVRLLLWPIGQFPEVGVVSARQSWRLMRGAFWPYVGAAILAGLPPGIIALSLVSLYRAHGALWALIAQAPFNGLLNLILTAVGVEVYRARVTEPDTLADVYG